MRQRSHQRAAAFTMIELLVVLCIMLIIAGLVLSVIGGVTARRREILAAKQVSDIVQAALLYNDTLATFPPDTGNLSIATASPNVLNASAFSTDEKVVAGTGSGPLGYATDSICRYLGTAVTDVQTSKTYGPFLLVPPSQIKTFSGGRRVYVCPFEVGGIRQPYMLDCVHIYGESTGVETELVAKDYKVKRVGAPFGEKEAKGWCSGPDGKVGFDAGGSNLPFSQLDTTKPLNQWPAWDRDNVKSW